MEKAGRGIVGGQTSDYAVASQRTTLPRAPGFQASLGNGRCWWKTGIWQ